MKPKKILSMIMAILMVVTMLPSLVFAAAAPAGELDGKLKFKGKAAVGTELSADYTKVTPEGLTDDYVTFQWSRKIGEELKEVGTEKTYTLTEEDLGNKIVLKITGIEEKGISGELKANTVPIVATPEEAPEETTEEVKEESAEEAVEALPEETTEEVIEELPEEGTEEIVEETSEAVTEEVQEAPAEEEVIDEEAAPIQTDDSVIQIGNEETLSIPEAGTEPASVPEELTYTAEAATEDATGVLDFGSVTAGYEEAPEAQYVTVTNTGTGVLNFTGIAPDHFMVDDIVEPLQPGASVTLAVQPRTGVEAGIYQDTITYTSEEGATASVQANLTVAEVPAAEEPTEEKPEAETPEAEEQPEEISDVTEEENVEVPAQNTDPEPTPTPNVSADVTDPVVFAAVEEGYAVPEAKIVTLKNSGNANAAVGVAIEETIQSAFTAVLSANEIAADNGTATLSIQPNAGLAAGTYSGNISITGTSLVFEVSFTVEAPKVYTLAAAPTALDFGTLENSYTPAAQDVVLTNTGNIEAPINVEANDYFDILNADGTAVTTAAVPAGGSLTLKVQPKAGLQAGTYNDKPITITPTGADTTAVTITAAVTVKAPDVFAISVNPDAQDFGVAETGYKEAPAAQTVTIKNEGTTAVNLTQPTAKNFEAGALSAVTLDPGATATFTLRPKTGLSESIYEEDIVVASDKSQTAVKAIFTVSKASVKLTNVYKAENITGLANKTEKSVEGLKLPSTVAINTSNGKMKANVKWDVKGSSYDQKSTEGQSFTVKGTITLPNGVTNPDNISLITSVKVSVNGRTAIIADPADNIISGIDPAAAYTTETKITITAIGAGMDNTAPGNGDTRYVPLNWKVLEARTWESAPYSATFRMGKNGSYTMTVTFNQQKYDGSSWVNTGAQDTKQVNFNVAAVTGQNLTPAADHTDANRKNAVQTGDDTPILPFVIILAAAVICIAGIVIYRKKNNK